MRNNKLIPFEVIEKAVAGEPEAIDTVLRHYAGRIKYLSTYKNGVLLRNRKKRRAIASHPSFCALCMAATLISLLVDTV